MKRLAILVILALVLALSVNAAGSGEGGSAQEEVVIRFNQHGQDWLGGLQGMVGNYSEIDPSVTIEVSRLGGEDFWASLRTVVASGDVHDLLAVQSGAMLNDFVEAGYLEPIDDLPVISEYSEVSKQVGTIDGHIYGMPVAAHAMGVVYNKDIFDELGLEPAETISELEEIVAVLKDAGYIPFAGYYNDVWTLRHLFSMAHTAIVKDPIEFTRRMDTGEIDSYRVEGMDRAMDVIDLMNANVQERPFDAGFGDATALLAQKKAAMLIQGTWSVGNITKIDPDFNAGMFALPVSDNPEDATLAIDSSVVWSVYSGTENMEKAKEVLNWLLQVEQMQVLGDLGDLMVVRGFKAPGSLTKVNESIQEYMAEGKTHRWGFNKWPSGFDMDVVGPAMQLYLRDGDRDALFAEIDSRYPN